MGFVLALTSLKGSHVSKLNKDNIWSRCTQYKENWKFTTIFFIEGLLNFTQLYSERLIDVLGKLQVCMMIGSSMRDKDIIWAKPG